MLIFTPFATMVFIENNRANVTSPTIPSLQRWKRSSQRRTLGETVALLVIKPLLVGWLVGWLTLCWLLCLGNTPPLVGPWGFQLIIDCVFLNLFWFLFLPLFRS